MKDRREGCGGESGCSGELRDSWKEEVKSHRMIIQIITLVASSSLGVRRKRSGC